MSVRLVAPPGPNQAAALAAGISPHPAVFERAIALLSKDGAWTRGYYARDRYGFVIGPESDRAVAWDLEGALWRAGAGVNSPEWRLVRLAIQTLGSDLLPHRWNDAQGRTQADVAMVLWRALGLCRGVSQSDE